MLSEEHDLARWFAAAARHLRATQGTGTTVAEICDLAVAVVAGCTSASVTEAHHDRGMLLAATDETAKALHNVQYELREGPDLEQIWQERIVWCDDFADERRWPRFAAHAVENGVHSMVAIQLFTQDDTLGSLNLFAAQPGAFDEVTREVAQIFASHAAVALATANEQAQLSEALHTRQRIGQATGILAERHGLTTEQAFTLLAQSSQNHNIKVRDLAKRIVAAEDAARGSARQRTVTTG
ncbi:MAG: ANTAR domain-containing protein [Streptosporangiales bacterium]|nr:ANTAR domain-containing protein [Streptosporangiales bacterium]